MTCRPKSLRRRCSATSSSSADLRLFENCQKVLKGCDHCFNLAADMGGMGFIQSNHSVIFYNNVMISFNMMEACASRA
jgi:GDP-D-mannose 3',5'-epimerase